MNGGREQDPPQVTHAQSRCGTTVFGSMRFSACAPFSFRQDGPLLLGLLVLIEIFVVTCFNLEQHPIEDAAMVMRYAQHLAAGHGFVWNIGEAPVDGATDFLFTIILAILLRLGLPVEAATRLVAFAAHVLTVMLVYFAVRRRHGLPRAAAFASAGFLATGPGVGYAVAHFGTPLFALLAVVCALFALALVEQGSTVFRAWGFAVASLLLGLARPEGVFLALLLLGAVLAARGWQGSAYCLLAFALVFTLLGGAYFAWRWYTFGYPLPNPFYKKGGGVLHWEHLRLSFLNGFLLCVPFPLAFVFGFRNRVEQRRTLALLLPLLGFLSLWVLVSNEMNYWMRFQYPVLPLVLLFWPVPLKGLASDWSLTWPQMARARVLGTCALWLLAAGLVARQAFFFGGQIYLRDGRYDVAQVLAEYRDHGYTLATSEAGLVPLYSGWRTIDTWGLNDPWIAHHGGVTEAYLDRYRPELILFHAYFSPVVAEQGHDDWYRMLATLKNYAEHRGYVLAAVYGDSPYDTHYYYVRPDFPHSAQIVRRIRSIDYIWHGTARRCPNYALLRSSDRN